MSTPAKKERTAAEFLIVQAAAALVKPEDYTAVMVIVVGAGVPPRVAVHGYGECNIEPQQLLHDLAKQLEEVRHVTPETATTRMQ